MKNDKKKSYWHIRAIGSAGVIGMACLTAFSVNLVIDTLNDDADERYWAAFNANRTVVAAQVPESSGTVVADNTESPSVEAEPEVTTAPEITDVPEVTTLPHEAELPDATTGFDETEPIITEDPEVTTSPDEIKESDISTEPVESNPVVDDGNENPEPVETDDSHNESGGNGDVDNGKSFDLTNCHLDFSGNLVYTVQRGDCLSKIGRRFECDYTVIGSLNKIADYNLITTGQQLMIPISDEMMTYARANLK